ncbi:MAG: sigma-70 family RNA polymerase sigma factor [Clostridia bacterium]
MDTKEFNYYLNNINNDKAINALFYFLYPKIIIWTVRRFKNEAFAEDVAAEFFCNLLKYKSNEYIKNPISWTYTLVHNIACSMIKSPKYCKIEIISEEQLLEERYPYIDTDLADEVNDLLFNLDKETRCIIMEKHFEEYTFKEIAQKNNLKIMTVYKKYKRGIKKLENLLKTCPKYECLSRLYNVKD